MYERTLSAVYGEEEFAENLRALWREVSVDVM
jgi:hypothetical protein